MAKVKRGLAFMVLLLVFVGTLALPVAAYDEYWHCYERCSHSAAVLVGTESGTVWYNCGHAFTNYYMSCSECESEYGYRHYYYALYECPWDPGIRCPDPC